MYILMAQLGRGGSSVVFGAAAMAQLGRGGSSVVFGAAAPGPRGGASVPFEKPPIVGSVTKLPTGASTNGNWFDINNILNTGAASSYGRGGSGALCETGDNYWIHGLGFDFSSIPAEAVITSILCQYYACSYKVTAHQVSLCASWDAGTNWVGSGWKTLSAPWDNFTWLTFEATEGRSWTVAELASLRVRMTSSAQSGISDHDYLNHMKVTVTYTI